MKDYQVGQECYVLRREYPSILKGTIIQKYENSNRFRVKFNFNKLFPHDYESKERIIARFQNSIDIFLTFDEAYKVAIKIFENRIEKIKEDRQRFIKECIEKGEVE